MAAHPLLAADPTPTYDNKEVISVSVWGGIPSIKCTVLHNISIIKISPNWFELVFADFSNMKEC